MEKIELKEVRVNLNEGWYEATVEIVYGQSSSKGFMREATLLRAVARATAAATQISPDLIGECTCTNNGSGTSVVSVTVNGRQYGIMGDTVAMATAKAVLAAIEVAQWETP